MYSTGQTTLTTLSDGTKCVRSTSDSAIFVCYEHANDIQKARREVRQRVEAMRVNHYSTSTASLVFVHAHVTNHLQTATEVTAEGSFVYSTQFPLRRYLYTSPTELKNARESIYRWLKVKGLEVFQFLPYQAIFKKIVLPESLVLDFAANHYL